MIVYLYNHTPIELADMLRQARITVWTSVNDMPANERHNFMYSALEKVNASILELSQTSADLQFVLAQAIILRHPTLCLYNKACEPNQFLQHLTKHHLPNMITIRAYTRATIDTIVGKFLKGLDRTIQLEDVPNIKFTLRLSPGLEHYLEWFAAQKRINKADYIRQLIREDAEHNKEYQGEKKEPKRK